MQNIMGFLYTTHLCDKEGYSSVLLYYWGIRNAEEALVTKHNQELLKTFA